MIEKFKLVTFTSLDMIHSRLRYPLKTRRLNYYQGVFDITIFFKKNMQFENNNFKTCDLKT